MSDIKNNKEVYDQAVTIEEDTSKQEPVNTETTQRNDEISSEKPGFWNVAKKICLGATIVFLLFAIISTSLLLANKPLRESISNMVWNGGAINLPEIDVFGYRERKTKTQRQNHQTKQNEIKILRTVQASDTHRSKEAIAFTPDLEHVPLGKFRKQDADVLPDRFMVNDPAGALSEEYLAFARLPNNSTCENAQVAITVKSSVDHFEHRQAIRDSWASIANGDATIVFLIGMPTGDSAEAVLEQIEREADEHEDIVLGQYIDSYTNLTVKALTGLAWRSEHCAKPEFTLSIDDDTYVDLDELLNRHLSRLPDADFVECSERTVVNGKVWREGRWAVPDTVYDAEKYPNYCNGPCYLMPKETSQQLYDVSRETVSDLQADDALITGVLRTKLEIPIIQYTRTKSPGWCTELSNRKPHLPKRMVKEFQKRQQQQKQQQLNST